MNYRKQLFIVSYYLIVLLNINQYCWVVSVLMCVLVHHWYQWTVFNEVKINPTDASDSWQTIYHMPGGISGPSRWTGSVWTWLPHKRLSLCLWIIRLDWVKINIHLRDHKLCSSAEGVSLKRVVSANAVSGQICPDLRASSVCLLWLYSSSCFRVLLTKEQKQDTSWLTQAGGALQCILGNLCKVIDINPWMSNHSASSRAF